MRRLLASPEFSNSSRLQDFLSFVVESALRGDSVKESVIAAEVYGRISDYDPAVDSAGRVDASRLRKKLKEYYNRTGASDRIRIEIPKSSYTPLFHGVDQAVTPDVSRRWFWAAAGATCAGAAVLLRLPPLSTGRAKAHIEHAGAVPPGELIAYQQALEAAGFEFGKPPEPEPYLRVVAAAAGSERYIALTLENGYPDSPAAGRTLHYESAPAARAGLTSQAGLIFDEAARLQAQLLGESAGPETRAQHLPRGMEIPRQKQGLVPEPK